MTPGNDAAIVVRRLRPELAGDYLGFFDGPAFVDNPQWARCYCHFHHLAPAIDWESLGRDDNRTAMAARIEVGEMDGFLAYRRERVVGWLNAQARHRLPHCFARIGIEATRIDWPDVQAASILCFVVDPAQRRTGVARTLLAAACDSFRERGFRMVEAYPARAAGDIGVSGDIGATGEAGEAADAGAAAHYRGPLQLFLAAGFAIVREDARTSVVRRALIGT